MEGSLWYVLTGTRGGDNRTRILQAIDEKPRNANQLATDLRPTCDRGRRRPPGSDLDWERPSTGSDFRLRPITERGRPFRFHFRSTTPSVPWFCK
jgi:hypothetical protein